MSAVEAVQTEGHVTNWHLGDPDTWATMDVSIGPLSARVKMDSRTARAFAIDVLTEQGPYLGYQPPNETMRENRQAPIMGHGRRKDGEPGWRKRGDVRDCARHLAELRERFGDEAFAWAVQRTVGS